MKLDNTGINHKPLVKYLTSNSLRKIVRLRSRGNLCLQKGLYSTEEDIKKRREKIVKYDFSKF